MNIMEKRVYDCQEEEKLNMLKETIINNNCNKDKNYYNLLSTSQSPVVSQGILSNLYVTIRIKVRDK